VDSKAPMERATARDRSSTPFACMSVPGACRYCGGEAPTSIKRRLCSSATFCKAGDQNEPFRVVAIAQVQLLRIRTVRSAKAFASGPRGEEARQRLPVHMRCGARRKRRRVNECLPEQLCSATFCKAGDQKEPFWRAAIDYVRSLRIRMVCSTRTYD
jgi:hypothetical protein